MTNITINKKWFEEVVLGHGLVFGEVFEYEEEGWSDTIVEVDIADEEKFNEISRECGWMY